ncbi:MAG: hypothetical protein OXH52_20215 [Gammaproteobacteria bacterium]|nr:hypothetical protein [Gammaproteobacteria bacterium]
MAVTEQLVKEVVRVEIDQPLQEAIKYRLFRGRLPLDLIRYAALSEIRRNMNLASSSSPQRSAASSQLSALCTRKPNPSAPFVSILRARASSWRD